MRLVAGLVAMVVLLGLGKAAYADVPPGTTQVRIMLDELPAQVPYSTEVVVGGRLEALVNGSWHPAENESMTVYRGSANWRVTSGANGRFAWPVLVLGPATYQFSWYAYVAPEVRATWKVTGVPRKVKLSMTGLSIDAFGQVTASGRTNGERHITGQVELQHRVGPARWKTIKRVRVGRGGEFRSGKVAYGRSGEFRWHLPAEKWYEESASPPRKVLRWATWFSEIKVSPSQAGFKKQVVVSGTLGRWGRTDGKTRKSGYAYRKVRLLFSCTSDESGTWYTNFGWVKTDAKGRFRKAVKALCSGNVVAYFYGGDDTFAAGSKKAKLKVVGR